MSRLLPIVLTVVALAACGGDDDSMAFADAGESVDGAGLDASPFPTAGFGTITGDCDVLDTELTDPAPALFRSAIDFAVPYTDADLGALSPGAQKIITDGNAGGSSVLSEAFSFDLLSRCELAALLKSENEIVYDVTGTKTDYLSEIDSLKIGVSVTRAVAFPFDSPYSVADAEALLDGKLQDILASTDNVAAEDAWTKQILSVLAYSPQHADALETALASLPAATTADTIVWILVTNGQDDFIYCNGPCP